MTAKPEKDLSIETLRGIAIVLLVSLHCIEGLEPGGARSEDWYAYYGYSFESLRMPLFTVISGYVYALRPLTGAIGSFLRGKARRILFPFFSVTTLICLFKALAPGITSPIGLHNVWRAYLFSFDHLWFLQAIFFVFVTISILESRNLLASPLRWAICLGSAFVLKFVVPPTEFLSLGGYFYLLPFFILGVGINRFEETIFRPQIVFPLVGLSIVTLTLQQLSWFGVVTLESGKHSVLGVLIGLSSNVVLFRYRRVLPFLPKLGFFAYTIYLFHGFGISIAERALGLVASGSINEHLLFVVKLAGGLTLPIIANRILMRIPLLSLVFLGLKSKSKAAPAEPTLSKL